MKKHIIAYGVPVLISTVLGFILWKITGDKLSSFLCALLINATILLIEHGSYIRKSQNALQFFSNPFSEKPYIESLFNNLIEIKKIGDPFLLGIAEEEATQCSHKLSNLRNSLWATENIREFLHFYSKLSEKKLCKRSYVGLSDCSEYINFWKTVIGKQVFAKNIEAIARGVNVKRVFVLKRNQFSELSSIMESQVKRGVDVRYIFTEDIGGQIEIIDYAIWDNSVCVKLLEPRHAGEDFKAEFYFGGKITERLNQHFKTLYNAAKAFEIKEG